jgi:hypothetical protein
MAEAGSIAASSGASSREKTSISKPAPEHKNETIENSIVCDCYSFLIV